MEKNITIAENFIFKVSWENSENWKLDSKISSAEEYIDEVMLTLTNDKEEEFPQMIVEFCIPKGEIASRWNANLHLDKV